MPGAVACRAIVVQSRVSATVDALDVLRCSWETVIKPGDKGWGDPTAALDIRRLMEFDAAHPGMLDRVRGGVAVRRRAGRRHHAG